MQKTHDRVGGLQRGVQRAMRAYGGEACTSQLAEWCWPRLPTLQRKHVLSMARAARSIGAVRVRRVGRDWLWRLRNSEE
jgi:hypothetical protein